MPSKATKKRRQEAKAQAQSQRQTASTSGGQEGAKFALAPKPPPSENGQLIKLVSNHYPLKVPNIVVYHYDVVIKRLPKWEEGATSEVPPEETTAEDVETVQEKGKAKTSKYACYNTKINRKVLQQTLDEDPKLKETTYVYDGKKNMYTKNKFPRGDLSIGTVFEDEFGRKCMFEVNISSVVKNGSSGNSISLEPLNELLAGRSSYIPQDAVMVLETILKNRPACVHVPVGRSFFPIDARCEELPGGRLLRKGYHQNVLLTESKAVINVDVAATTFYKPGSVIGFLKKLVEMIGKEKKREFDPLEKMKELPSEVRRRLEEELIGCRVYAKHFTPHRKYKVHGMSEESADNIKFKVKEKEISVTEYFKETYNKDLRYGGFPCLKVHKEREIYLPLEVCEIPEGEHCIERPNKVQTTEMIKKTTLPPKERFQQIQRTVDNIIENFAGDLESFTITIDGNPVKVEGRVLECPTLLYKNTTKNPKDGKWNLVNQKVRNGVEVKKWAVLAASDYLGLKLNNFANALSQTARKFGLIMHPVEEIMYARNRNEADNLCALLKNLHQKVKDVQLVVIVLRSKADKNYCKIKYTAEKELGLITQCLSEEFFRSGKNNEQFLANLCLKINGKLGGINSTVKLPPILNDSTMIIGADCNHPSPNDKVRYSVAAAVCNLDRDMGQFATACTIQPRKEKRIELIKKLKYMVIQLLKYYHQRNKKYPEKIILFRDGVSEGEYMRALQEEVPQVQEACDEVIRDGRPKITFLIVTKRHHTRVKVEEDQDGVKPEGNVPPGTKIDTIITHVLNFDFYLCSHNGIKGTSRPAHYTVIYDENDFGSPQNKPQLEKLCYFLCHTSSRCTQSVSIPAPVDYADKAAYRAKQYLLAAPDVESLISEWSQGVKVATTLSDRMYFI